MDSKHGCIFPTSLYPCPYNGISSHIFLLTKEFFLTLWIWTALCPGLARKCCQSNALASFNTRPQETSQTCRVAQWVNNIRLQGNERHRPGSFVTPYANRRQVRPFQTSYQQSSHIGNLDIQPFSSGPNHKNYHLDLKSLRSGNGYHLKSLAGAVC